MCLFPMNNTIEIAKQDIHVWKIILRSNVSMYQSFEYQPNTLYRLRRKLKIETETEIGSPQVNNGFHAYHYMLTTIRAYQRMRNGYYKIVDFTIPKGAKYIIGTHGDIVATSIRSGSLMPSCILKG